MTASELTALLDRLAGTRVVCVGDVMLDRFVYGVVERISPEAPIPVLRVDRELTVLGGAGNVVRNLVALGAKGCFLTVVGDDPAGRELTDLISHEDQVEPHLLVEKNRTTTIKTRLIAASQQLLRTDRETVVPIRDEVASDLIDRAKEAMDELAGPGAVLVLSDYGKGVLRPDVTQSLIQAAREKGFQVIVDPKGRCYRKYAGAHVLTPNRRELHDATGLPCDDDAQVEAAARRLMAECQVDAVLVTRSQDGMTLVTAAPAPVHLPAQAREVFDVSGAGDTVIAVTAAGLASGAPLAAACELANAAAGVVVGKIGTAVASPAEIAAAIHARDIAAGEEKIYDRHRAADLAQSWRRQGRRIGFTNGCFDLLHPGHVSLLAQARAACDKLIVGLNSDSSVKRLKGDSRPVQSELARAIVLASIGHVDAVVIFGEDTPLELIKTLKPDVLVKGADYTLDKVVGAEIVASYGGKVMLASLEHGYSTSNAIAKIMGG